MRVADDVAWVRSSAEMRDYCLIARVPHRMPLELTGSAVYLWECWAGGMSLEESVSYLAEVFSEDPEVIRPQAESTQRSLADQGFLIDDSGESVAENRAAE
ncbi:hypothetical protein [Kocuria massiliensis]|uniref:hypothetical protein n=1 Tax=Kocuria massiliensis TaxID=1926282 RepID=UPI0022B9C622|nr:hypothetical protein [Kocuria massiliensis]